ncbi:MAG: hypothetical protein Q8W44_10385 [Candidatus Palauibacterales bacterium]|nr:hypothetical protein [Candidatus Palauibacterales bacterium]
MSDHSLAESRANPVPSEPIQIAVMGLGPIGQEIAQVLARKGWADLVAAVDVDPALEGRPLSEVAELDREVGVDVTPSLDVDCDVVAHATVSDLESATHQVVPHLKDGRSVVSTCEELAFPLNDRLARRLDEAGRDGGSTVLGTGINPGFLLDALPAVLTVSCQSVDHVTASRIVNASERRGPLQEKVGAGLDLEEWRRRRDEGEIRHVGLPESARMLAAAVGWSDLTFSDEVIEPVTAPRPVTTDVVEVEEGEAAGVRHLITGSRDGREVLRLELAMYVGAEDPGDAVKIRGVPPVDMKIRDGVHGDRATAAVVANMVPRTVAAGPGLVTMAELPLGASL